MKTYSEKKSIVVYPCLEFEETILLIDDAGEPVYYTPDIKNNEIKKVTTERFFDTVGDAQNHIKLTEVKYKERAEKVKQEIKELVNTEYFSFKELMPDGYKENNTSSFFSSTIFLTVRKRIRDLALGWIQIDRQRVRLSDIIKVHFTDLKDSMQVTVHTSSGVIRGDQEDAQFLYIIFS